MTSSYVLFAMVWAVTVAASKPPLVVGALLVAIPVVLIGLILSGASDASSARS